MLRTPLLDNSDGGIQYNYYQYHYRVGEVAALLQKGGCKRHAARYEQNYYREVLELLEKLRRKALFLFAAQQVFAASRELKPLSVSLPSFSTASAALIEYRSIFSPLFIESVQYIFNLSPKVYQSY